VSHCSQLLLLLLLLLRLLLSIAGLSRRCAHDACTKDRQQPRQDKRRIHLRRALKMAGETRTRRDRGATGSVIAVYRSKASLCHVSPGLMRTRSPVSDCVMAASGLAC
jgi:hypothetical protein